MSWEKEAWEAWSAMLARILDQGKQHFSSAPLATLAPVHLLDDLQPGSRAKGRALYGVITADALRHEHRDSTLVMSMIRDSTGSRLCLLMIKHGIRCHSSKEERQAAFPKEAQVAVKEPKLHRLYSTRLVDFIVVDSPTEVVVISYLGDPRKVFPGMSPGEIRSHGNKLFKAASFNAAAEAYRHSFELARKLEPDEPQEQLLALSNQAECLLNLGRFEDCIDVADEALALDPAHCKSIYRKALALIELHLYDWAAELLESFSGEIDTDHASSIGELRSRARNLAGQSLSGAAVLEEITGYVKKVTTVRSTVKLPDLADYIGPVEARICPDQRFNRGRGLFATRDIHRGEVVMVTKAAIYEAGSYPDRVTRLVELCMKSPRRHQQIHSLAGKEVPEMKLFSPNWITAGEWSSYRGSIKREELLMKIDVEGLYKVASVSPEDDAEMGFSAMWLVEELMNHSCVPNVCDTSFLETRYMVAGREIAAGEELVLSYSSLSRPQGMNALEKNGIRCDCLKCDLERRLERELAEMRSCYFTVTGKFKFKASSEMALKLEEVLNSELESEEERQCVRAIYSTLYVEYYRKVKNGNVASSRGRGVPAAEVIMAAVVKFSAGENALALEFLEPFARDRVAAAKIIRESWECKLGAVMKDDELYEATKGNAELQKVMSECCHRFRMM